MTYDILATGSSGNAVVINGEILIDCGVSYRTLEQSGYIKDLQLVLLTHSHGDHFNPTTVRRIHQERPALRWGCCEWMVGPLLEAGVDKRVIDAYGPDSDNVYGGILIIHPGNIPHDAPNCCYHIMLWNFALYRSEKLFYATDTSTLAHIEAKNYDCYLIEANHTEAEIEARIAEKRARGEFAYETRAARNHLSQEQALKWLTKNVSPERWNSTQIEFLHQHKEVKHA